MNEYVKAKNKQGKYKGALNNYSLIENYNKHREKIRENMTNDKVEEDKLLKKVIEEVTKGVEKAICQVIKE